MHADPLRVLLANENAKELELLADSVELLGQNVVGRETRVDQVARIAADLEVEVALVVLPAPDDGIDHTDHALAMIGQLVQSGLCPVVAVTRDADPAFATGAAELGVYAYTTGVEPLPLSSAIDVATRRFKDHVELRQIMRRQVLIERAKGIIMERYDLGEHAAFEMLRHHARDANLKIGAAADLVAQGHRLLPKGHGRS